MFLNFRYTEQFTCFRLLWYHSLTGGHFNTLHLEWQIQSEACSATLLLLDWYSDLKRDLNTQDKGWHITKNCLNCSLEPQHSPSRYSTCTYHSIRNVTSNYLNSCWPYIFLYNKMQFAGKIICLSLSES